ncbi:MAG: hypothetical protein ACPG9N_06705, partial [Miltoncostaeaceae bacterium]
PPPATPPRPARSAPAAADTPPAAPAPTPPGPDDAPAARADATDPGDAAHTQTAPDTTDAAPDVPEAVPAAAERPAEPVPADAEHIGRAWPRILGILEQRSPHLHAFLQDSEVRSVEDGVLTIAVKGTVAVGMLSRPDERTGVTAVVRDICGQDITVAFAEAGGSAATTPAVGGGPAAGDAGPGAPVDHQQLIDELRTAFGAELIDTDNRE